MSDNLATEAISLPISGELDLHHFKPKEIPELLDEFLYACKSEGIREGRIIHGKGIGTLREMVHRKLRKHPFVESFNQGSQNSENWGVTSFRLLHNPTKNGWIYLADPLSIKKWRL